ncbi:aerobic glycerol-3-phosphate dehydrogenase [Vibrio maritimus]|uniref:Aerobic glycerol-3-phosphate dehydrogenase n=1 Tax=Vibrio maritimus TaxID=990268 RepID=A0A090T548_9VIBR|nr:aerobic glycerol-3-phosphate dehydrogenase [Vibrio maritimus]
MGESNNNYDVIVIGGGINGVAVAADAAGRGLDVALVEMNDLASATSSASSNSFMAALDTLNITNFVWCQKH